MTRSSYRPGPRHLEIGAIVDGAIEVLETHGAESFTLTKVGARVGCDPMTVTYHFGSKGGLQHAMAERLCARLQKIHRKSQWRQTLCNIAAQYRGLAQKFPQTFQLVLHSWMMRRVDHRHVEIGYSALIDAGFAADDVVDYCMGWYAAVLGLIAAEAGGLLRPATPVVLDALSQLPAAKYPKTLRLMPALRHQIDGQSFDKALAVLLDGLEAKLTRTKQSQAALQDIETP